MKKLLQTVLFAILAFTTKSAIADIVVTFDTTIEGWGVVDIVQPINGIPTISGNFVPQHISSGGNPGGAISQQDPSGDAWFFSASTAVRSELAVSLGGTMSWDLAVNETTSGSAEQLILSDGTTAMYYVDTAPGPANVFRTYQVSLRGSSFRIGSKDGSLANDNDLQTVLSGLNSVYILGDWGGIETARLDNVRVTAVPEPSTAILILSAVPILLRQRSRKRLANKSGRS